MVDREARCVTETEEMHVDAAFEAEDAEEQSRGTQETTQVGGTSRFVRQTTLTRTKSERPITRPA